MWKPSTPPASDPVPFSEAELNLRVLGVKYMKQANGTLLVPGDLRISGRGMTRLPDLSSVVVEGFFNCNDNHLTSLEGAPARVGGDVYCSNNQLESLKGAPAVVGGSFWCTGNKLISLEGAPASVGGCFWCNSNKLSSLEYAPAQFKSLSADFGNFSTPGAIPEELRFSPETRQKQERERQEQERLEQEKAAKVKPKRPRGFNL